MKNLWIVAALGVLAMSCGRVIVVDGIRVYEDNWRETTEELTPRASFDFDCAPQGLEFSLLQKAGRHPSSVGVTGCGRRATYTRVGRLWFSDSESQAAVEHQRSLDEQRRLQQQ